MRIAIDCRMSGKSGIGAFIDSMLPTFKQSGHELLLIGKDEPCAVKPFSVKEMLFFPRALLKKINSCDAYFTPYCNIPGRIFSRGITVPFYATIHDVIFLDMPGLAGRFGTFLRKIFYARAARKSRTLFTVSEFSKSRIEHFFGKRTPIRVVYSGVPLYNEAPLNELRASKTNTIIFVGNIKAHKGIKTLIPAFIKFREKNDSRPNDARLLIVGSKENFRTGGNGELDKMIQCAEENGIEWTGFLPDETLARLIAAARVLVQPSLYEGFGVPPLQALYSGTRAVISDIPVFKEIYARLPVTFFKAGDADDLAEKLVQVWNEKEPLEEVERIYSYRFSAQMILNEIENNARIEK